MSNIVDIRCLKVIEEVSRISFPPKKPELAAG